MSGRPTRCVHCGRPLGESVFLCGACGVVQPPPGEGADWYESEEYEIGADAQAEGSEYGATVGAGVALCSSIVLLALLRDLPAMSVAAAVGGGLVWCVTALALLSRRLGERPSLSLRVAVGAYGLAVALFGVELGLLVLRLT